MISLFNETANPQFRLLCQLVSAAADGQKFDRPTIIARLQSVFAKYEPGIERENEIIDTLFFFDKNGIAHPYNSGNITLPPRLYELRWLKSLLLDATASFLFAPKLKTKLHRILSDIEPLYAPNLLAPPDTALSEAAGPAVAAKLAVIRQALNDRRQIYCEIPADDGRLRRGVLPPLRLEYDLKSGQFFLILWDEPANRAIKIRVARLGRVSVAAAPLPDDIDEKFAAFLKEQRQKLILRLTPKYNAFDRCYSLFAAYDKTTEIIGDDLYRLTVYYYRFDRREVLEKILSLGSAVVVLEPADLRAEIIEHLKASRRYLRALSAPPAD